MRGVLKANGGGFVSKGGCTYARAQSGHKIDSDWLHIRTPTPMDRVGDVRGITMNPDGQNRDFGSTRRNPKFQVPKFQIPNPIIRFVAAAGTRQGAQGEM